MTPPPPHFGARRFRDPFRQVALAGLCLPILWLILFDLDLGRSWQILSEPCLFICRLKKIHLQTSVQKRCSKTTTNPVNNSKLAKDRPQSAQNRSTKIPLKVNRNRFGKKVNHKAQRGTTQSSTWPIPAAILVPAGFRRANQARFLDLGRKNGVYCVVCSSTFKPNTSYANKQ